MLGAVPDAIGSTWAPLPTLRPTRLVRSTPTRSRTVFAIRPFSARSMRWSPARQCLLLFTPTTLFLEHLRPFPENRTGLLVRPSRLATFFGETPDPALRRIQQTFSREIEPCPGNPIAKPASPDGSVSSRTRSGIFRSWATRSIASSGLADPPISRRAFSSGPKYRTKSGPRLPFFTTARAPHELVMRCTVQRAFRQAPRDVERFHCRHSSRTGNGDR